MSDSNYVLAGFETLGTYFKNFCLRNLQNNWDDNFTPEILINGKSFPKEYDRQDLLFFIEEFSNYEQFYESAEKAGYAGTSVCIKKNKLTNSTFTALVLL